MSAESEKQDSLIISFMIILFLSFWGYYGFSDYRNMIFGVVGAVAGAYLCIPLSHIVEGVIDFLKRTANKFRKPN